MPREVAGRAVDQPTSTGNAGDEFLEMRLPLLLLQSFSDLLFISLIFSHEGFFIPGFPKLQRFQAHHEQILSKLFPKLKKHMVSLCYQSLHTNIMF